MMMIIITSWDYWGYSRLEGFSEHGSIEVNGRLGTAKREIFLLLFSRNPKAERGKIAPYNYVSYILQLNCHIQFLPSFSKNTVKIEDTQPEKILQNTFETFALYKTCVPTKKILRSSVYNPELGRAERALLSTTSTQLSYPKKTRPIELEFAKKWGYKSRFTEHDNSTLVFSSSQICLFTTLFRKERKIRPPPTFSRRTFLSLLICSLWQSFVKYEALKQIMFEYTYDAHILESSCSTF